MSMLRAFAQRTDRLPFPTRLLIPRITARRSDALLKMIAADRYYPGKCKDIADHISEYLNR